MNMTNNKVEGLVLKEGATLDQGERVAVYYNLNRGGFSIKSIDKNNPMFGKVIGHAENVLLTDADFHIVPSAYKNIFKTGYKEVYARVRGYYVGSEKIDNNTHKWGYCNPYQTEGKFIDWETKKELTTASTVYFYKKFFSYLP